MTMESESLKNQPNERIAKTGCAILIALPLVAIFVFITILVLSTFPPRNIFLADKNEPSDVALAFAYSLPFNKMDEMKSYVVQEKWEFLDNWSEVHAPISKKCRYPWDPDFQNTMMFGGNDIGGSSLVSLFYTYDCPEYSYWFDIGGLELKIIDEKWQIVDWEEICEERGSGRGCFDSNFHRITQNYYEAIKLKD